MADESKFYWIKLYTDFFGDDSPMDFLLGVPNGAEYVALYLKLCLATANNDGKLCCNFGEMIVPYNAEKIQRDMKHFSIDTVRVAMKLYQQMGLIYEEADGVLRITGFDSIVGSESAKHDAVVKRRYRARLKEADKLADKKRTNCPIEIEKELEIEKDIDIEIDKEIKKDKKTKVLASASGVYFPNDELLNDTFLRYVEMRKAIRKPLTEYAAQQKIEKLNKLASGNNDVAIEIIKKAIDGDWLDFYSLKENKGTNSGESVADSWLNA